MPSAVIGALRVNLGIDSAQFTKGLQNAQRSLKGVGQSMQRIGRQMSLALTAPITGIGVLAVREFASFEKALIGVGKTTDIAGAELERLGSRIEELARTSPTATTELLGIAQAAGQLGVRGEANLVKFTATVAKLGSATNLAGEEAASTLTTLLTLTGTDVSEIDRLGASIVDLGNNFNATEAQIAAAATRVAQATARFEPAAADVLAIGTAMSAVGVQAEAGGTVIGQAFAAIDSAVRNGGKEMQALTRITGQTQEAFRALFETDPAAAFEQLIVGLGKIQAAGGDVSAALGELGLSGIRIDAVLGTLATRSDVLTAAFQRGKTAYEENTALNKEAAAAAQSLDARFQMLRNQFTEAARAIAEQMVPAILRVTEGLGDLFEAISETSPALLRIVTALAGIAAVAGPLLIVLGGISLALSGLSPVMLVTVAAVAAVVAGIVLFREAIKAVTPLIKPMGDVALEVFQRIRQDARGLAKSLEASFEAIKVAWFNALELMRGAWAAFLADVAGIAAAIPGLGGFADDVADAMTTAMAGTEAAKSSADEARAAYGRLADEAGRLAVEARKPLKSINAFNEALHGTEGQAASGGAAISRLIDDFKRTGEEVSTTATEIGNSLADALGGGGGGSGGGGGGGGGIVDEYKRIVEGGQRFVDHLKIEQEALGMSGEAADRLRFTFDLLNQAIDAGINLTSRQADELRALADEMAAAQDSLIRAEFFEDTSEATQRFIAEQRMEIRAMGMTEEAATALRISFDLLNRAKDRGLELSPFEAAQIKIQAQMRATAEVARKTAEQTRQFWRDTAGSFVSDLRSGIEQGKSLWLSFRDAVLDVLDRITDRLLNQVLDALFKVNNAGTGGGGGGIFGGIIRAISGAFGGGGGGGLTSVSQIPTAGVKFAPGFASGGVASGLAMVGERGRELVNFGSPSRVFSNSETEQMMGRGNVSIGDTILNISQPNMTEAQLQRALADNRRRTIEDVTRLWSDSPRAFPGSI